MTAFGAELGAGQEFCTTTRAFVLGFQGKTAFRAEFGVGGKRFFTIGTGGSDPLAPVLRAELFVLLGHGRVSPDFFYRARCLRGCHFDAQVGGAFFAQPFFLVPAFFTAYP